MNDGPRAEPTGYGPLNLRGVNRCFQACGILVARGTAVPVRSAQRTSTGRKEGAGGLRQARVPTPLESLASGGKCRPVSTCRPAPRLTWPWSRPGVVKHIWVTTTGSWRELVLRMFWDGADEPAVEVPLGDFFCNGWDRYSAVNSIPVVVAPYRGFNSYWEMPFRTGARITLENVGRDQVVVYYQVDYVERGIDEGVGYFHARWPRENPVADAGLYEILDCPTGPGLFCGTYLAVGVNSPGWWERRAQVLPGRG